MNVIGYRQVRWFFRYAQEKLLVFSVLLGYRLLLDSSANFTCISARKIGNNYTDGICSGICSVLAAD